MGNNARRKMRDNFYRRDKGENISERKNYKQRLKEALEDKVEKKKERELDSND